MLAKPFRIYIIATEESGDVLGADMLIELRRRYPQAQIAGIGGEAMRLAGLNETLFPMSDLSLMGVAEILPHLPKLIGRIHQTAQDIKDFDPDIVLSIDGPDFCFRVQKKIKKYKLKAKQIHCVAPTVWAWREGRAKKIAKFLDGILCLFPFEPPYFEKYDLPAVYTGHPFLSRLLNKKGRRPTAILGRANKVQTIGVYFGSRSQEIKAHAPIFAGAIALFLNYAVRDYKIIVPTFAKYEDEIREAFEQAGVTAEIVFATDKKEREAVMPYLDYALAASGTVGLELALCEVLHCIGYKTSTLTYTIVKNLVTTKYAHLANIIMQDEIVPEFLQHDCTPQKLADGMMSLLDSAEKQEKSFKEIKSLMKTKRTPSETAVDFIEDVLSDKQVS